MKQGVTKGGAVERIARFLNIPLGAIMAVGDGANDIEMMQKVGLAVSVASFPLAQPAQTRINTGLFKKSKDN